MAATVRSSVYDADLWDLQSAMAEAPVTQERPVLSDLDELYFDCGDLPMQEDGILTPDQMIPTLEADYQAIHRVRKDKEAHGPTGDLDLWRDSDMLEDFDMCQTETLTGSAKAVSEQTEAVRQDEVAQRTTHGYGMCIVDGLKEPKQAKSNEAEVLQKGEEEAEHLSEKSEPKLAKSDDVETVQKEEEEKAQHLTEESEPEFEEGQSTQKQQATERKREYKQKFDKWYVQSEQKQQNLLTRCTQGTAAC